MKKAAVISGLLTIIMAILFLSGVIDFHNAVAEAVQKGNRYYASGDYADALDIYKEGLTKNLKDNILNFNSGQAAYRLGEFEQAAAYYKNAPDTLDKFINQGNSYLKLGDNARDEGGKQQYYQQALESYKQGIIEYPENVELKYNYEFVKKRIEQSVSDENQQENQNQNQDQSQDQNQNGDNEQNQSQDQNQDQSQSQEQDQGQDQNQGQDQSRQDSSSESGQNQDGSTAGEADNSQEAQPDSEIAQALEMLEKQEEDSLKNNQEINQQGTEEEYGW